MEFSHAERLKSVVRWLCVALGKTQADIARECGYDNESYFSQLLNGKKPIAASLDDKVAALHPDLNVEFLRGNSENMFLDGAAQPAMPALAAPAKKQPRPEGLFIPAELVQMFTDLSATVRSQQETIRLLVGEKGAGVKVM